LKCWSSLSLLLLIASAAQAQNLTLLDNYCREPIITGLYANNYLLIKSNFLKRFSAGYEISVFNEKFSEQTQNLELGCYILDKKMFKINIDYLASARMSPFTLSNYLLLGGGFQYKNMLLAAETVGDFNHSAIRWNASAAYDAWRQMFIATSIGYNKHTLYSELEYGLGVLIKEGRLSGSVIGFIPTKDGLDRFLLLASLYITVMKQGGSACAKD
jgi:hypothetical protein